MEGTLMYYTAEKSGEHALYKATRNNGSGIWSPGVNEISFNEYIKGYVVKTPFLTYDEQTLYFSANLPGSRGFDIFYSKRNGDSWSKPVSLSPVINSERDEISPSLSADNLTIYFTRNGLDNDCYSIYTSGIDISGWSVPQILPVPVSTGCEKYVYIYPTGETLLFSSDRFSEKKKKKYSVFHTTLISKNVWTPPSQIDNNAKEYNEFTPAVDYRNNKVFVTKSSLDSLACSIDSYDFHVFKPYTVLKGTVKDENGKPVGVDITVKDAYIAELYGRSENNPVTGEYAIVLPNNGLYNINYAVKNGSQQFESINTANNSQGQVIKKDITLTGEAIVNITVQDALSDRTINAEVQAYEKTKTAKVSELGEGRYQVTAPVFESVDIELYKENYVKENIIIRFNDYMNLPEMFYSVKLKPDIRSGVINVKNIVSDEGISADVTVKNLNNKDDKVHISSPSMGRYEFNIRKDSKYSISVILKDHFYYYAVWKADASRVGQTLDVRPVPLKDVNKIPMLNLLFPDGESTLSPEAMGELDCVVTILKNNPEYTAVISLYHLPDENELAVAQQRARSVITFMESSWVPKTGYRVEIVSVDKVKPPEINFVVNIPTDKR
jgi:outer membrane protein OmpA-like peptidoglycan-associated protein